MDSSISALSKSVGYYEGTIKAYIEAKGLCVYCDENLLKTRPGFSSMCIDHLLPKVDFPMFAAEQVNHVLACSSCNTMKGKFNPLKSELGENAALMLNQNKKELIARVRVYLGGAIRNRDEEWKRVAEIVSNAIKPTP